MGDHEREAERGFVEYAPAGSVLERAINRIGARRESFGIWNVVPTQPPNNYLEGADYEADAIHWGLTFLSDILSKFKPRAILALGNVALKAVANLHGITTARGYPVPGPSGIPVVGSLHPAFLRRGAMSYLGVLMHDLKLTIELAADPTHVKFWSPVLWRTVEYKFQNPLPSLTEPIVPPGYMCYPTGEDALGFLHCCESDPKLVIAYDIETPRSHKTTEDETDELEETQILSIQFSIAPESGIFMPWREPYISIARRILALPNPKVGANCWRFDDPRLAANSCPVAGTRHDLRWAWKHFQPDLSAGLQAITSFYAPDLGPWKHLDKSHPQVYGIRDCDSLLRCI